ncbi:MAG: cobalamin-independent methionine synthase II family protein [Actinobacteria bacterium]|nr:cobalamin-independent methionine synthase II family protein [Actinomycetota bacterium]
MSIPTEPIGSIPRPQVLIDGTTAFAAGELSLEELRSRQDEALRDTIERFESTGSPVITDGEQTKSSFITYPLDGIENLASEGAVIPFADGHTRQLPRLTSGPFRFGTYADGYVEAARKYANAPVKQAVIAASAISLIYPQDGIDGYPREAFVDDLVAECRADIRRSLDAGAHSVQIDFTEGRLSVKLDPSKRLLAQFVDLNNQVLAGFSDDERARIGIHTCPGGDQDSTHSADIDYAELLPELFRTNVGNVYVELAGESERERVLAIIAEHLRPEQRIFVGVINPIDPRPETPEEVRDRVLEAAEHLPTDRLGTCDDCGFSPFGDDTSTSRDLAFEKIRARVEGTRLAAEKLGL